jgi:exodeoxyribonuclease V beta subunit
VSPQPLNPEPFDITGPLPVGPETTLLEASAGTGKTWTIASLVARYVAEGHCRLDELLVVTFGRAASEELRLRVREQLVAAERVLSPEAGPAEDPQRADPRIRPLFDLLCAGGPDEVALRHARVREALSTFDGATIATTHQFCQMVLTGLGIAGDTDASARLVEDLDDLVTQVVDDLYVRGFAQQTTVPEFTRAEAGAIARTVTTDPQAEIEPASGTPGAVAARRVSFAKAVRDEFDRRKRRLGVLSYDDLLIQLADALADEAAPARERMRQRWRVVLVDEFQDTDPVQWQVLDRAFSGHATMVLIGDPKQAIYAFRGGDVVTYLAAAGSADRHATLRVNHRSDAGLVAQLQALLVDAELGDPGIVVRPVTAAHKQPRLLGAPHPAPFRLRVVDRAALGAAPDEGLPVNRLRPVVAQDLADDVAQLFTASATFDGRPLEARDVAVISDTRGKLAEVAQALRERGVPTVLVGSGSVLGTPAGQAWLTLLQALAQPSRSAAVRAASLTPFLGRSPADLDAGGDRVTAEDSETVRGWADLLSQRGPSAVLELAGADGRLAIRVLREPDGARMMTDLRHVTELLDETAADGHTAPGVLAAWLSRQRADDVTTVSPDRVRRQDSDAAAVHLLTIHASKGLQFPVVYAPSLADLHSRREDHPLYHDAEGQRCVDVSGSGGQREAAALAETEDSGEELRKLYVAVTRAQGQLVTWWVPSNHNTAASALNRVVFGRRPGGSGVPTSAPVRSDADVRRITTAWEEAGAFAVETCSVDSGTRMPPAPPAESLAVRRFTRTLDRAWTRTSYSGLAHAAEEHESRDPDRLRAVSEPEDPPREDEPELPVPGESGSATGVFATTPSPMADLPTGATFGSLVHAVLEHADPDLSADADAWRAQLRHQVTEQRVWWPVDLDADVLAGALAAVTDTPLGPLAGEITLRQIGGRQRLTELNFELPLGGGDRQMTPTSTAVLRDVAELWRRHVPADDPLAAYADTLDHPAYEQRLRGYLSGSLDLVFGVGDPQARRYFVADYKTTWVGERDEPNPVEAYAPDRLGEAMVRSSYPLQALLYSVALHRFLRWRQPGYRYDDHVGGVLYLYVRGMAGPDTPRVDGQPCGVFAWHPSERLVESVSALFGGRVAVA